MTVSVAGQSLWTVSVLLLSGQPSGAAAASAARRTGARRTARLLFYRNPSPFGGRFNRDDEGVPAQYAQYASLANGQVRGALRGGRPRPMCSESVDPPNAGCHPTQWPHKYLALSLSCLLSPACILLLPASLLSFAASAPLLSVLFVRSKSLAPRGCRVHEGKKR